MLRDILDLFRRSPGATLTPAAIGSQLGLSPSLVEHMLRTLVRSGRLVELESGAGCASCPLERLCVGGLTTHERCYVLREADGPGGPD